MIVIAILMTTLTTFSAQARDVRSTSSYDITKTVVPEGTGTVYARGILIDDDEYVRYRIEATPEPSWKFTGWSGDLSGTENPVEFDLYMNMTIIANFAPQTFTSPLNWSITKITGDYSSGIKPSTSGSRVAWQFTNDWEDGFFNVYLWDGAITQMSPADVDAHNPSLDGTTLAYEGYDGTDYEVYYRVGLDPRTNITDDDLLDTKPSLDAGWIAFETLNGTEWNIRYWNGSSISELSRTGQDRCPSIHSGQIAWQGFDGNDYEIFLWDGYSTVQITDNDNDDTNPSLYGGQIAWENNGDILFYDGSSTRTVTTDNNYYTDPSLHKGAVAFKGIIGQRGDIFFWDGIRIQNIPHNYDDQEPSLSSDGGKWTLSWRANDSGTTNFIWFATLEDPAIRDILTSGDGSTEIKWLSLEGNSYTVYYSDDPYGVTMTWNIAQTDVPGSSPLTSWIDDGSFTGGRPAAQRYYRIELQVDRVTIKQILQEVAAPFTLGSSA